MIIISSYKLAFKSSTKKYHIISNEVSVCPVCFNNLTTKDYRDRIGLTDTGERLCLVVKRFRCNGCGKTHTELPDMLFPYKHYTCKVIESVIGGCDDCPADNSTILRWTTWFRVFLIRVEAMLRAIYQTILHKQTHVFSGLSYLDRFMNLGKGWLPKLIRYIVNAGYY